MPGLQGDNVVVALGSPVKKSKLSLKFFQKKETKRALDFSELQADVPKSVQQEEAEASSCDQVVPGPSPCPASPGLLLTCEKRETVVPFVGLNNLGNTCYLNSILQVLYYCPGLKEGTKRLYSMWKHREKQCEESIKSEETDGAVESLPAHMELLSSFNSLVTSLEQLQSGFLLSPDSFGEGELATPPRKILHTLRQLNPMYEGYLQHDAQEVLQCILGYIQEACDTVRKSQDLQVEERVKAENGCLRPDGSTAEDDGQVAGKRKSDTEVGNAKKKPKASKSNKPEAENPQVTRSQSLSRSKRKSSGDKDKELEDQDAKASTGEKDGKGKEEKAFKEADGKGKKRAKLSWLRPSKKQPNIFSKFRSVGKITSATAKSRQKEDEDENAGGDRSVEDERSGEEENAGGDPATAKHQDGLDLMERLFQGQLVLRTRCLECESFTERREDFQDISVPVLEDQPGSPEDLSEVSPDPKPELKTLRWAIGQFASVERIVGEDKYFCETCHHYTEAERSLLFDKTPEVITIHLKRFSASSLELDPYVGLSKVNTPLQTPLTLSLEEWCTPASSSKGQRYQLFAVVMHSGVTISSGHYTAYVRMCGLGDVRLQPQDGEEAREPEESRADAGVKEEAPDSVNGDTSAARPNARGQRGAGLTGSKSGGKKLSEGGVGLLGGQRSFSSCDLGTCGGKQAEKAEASKRRKTIGGPGHQPDPGPEKEAEVRDGTGGEKEAVKQQALGGLLDFEGKWLLFDDSEVRLFEEEEFLQACSPETCSSSTPYLLFYRRMPKPGQ